MSRVYCSLLWKKISKRNILRMTLNPFHCSGWRDLACIEYPSVINPACYTLSHCGVVCLRPNSGSHKSLKIKYPNRFSQYFDLNGLRFPSDLQWIQNFPTFFGTAPRSQTMPAVSFTYTFHNLFSSHASSRYFSNFLLSFTFILWLAWMGKTAWAHVIHFFWINSQGTDPIKY